MDGKMAMNPQADAAPPGAQPGERSRRARLHGLLFAGAASGSALVMLVGALDPKLPPFQGE